MFRSLCTIMSSERIIVLIGFHMIFSPDYILILKEILQLLLSRDFLSKLVWDTSIFKNRNTEVHRLLRKQMEFQNILKIDFFFLGLKNKG